jgi:predicted DNA-binding protein
MTTMQVELTESQEAGLDALSRTTGKTRQQLVREAIEGLIDGADQVEWRAALERLEGIWADRTDLPDFDELRREWDRDPWCK